LTVCGGSRARLRSPRGTPRHALTVRPPKAQQRQHGCRTPSSPSRSASAQGRAVGGGFRLRTGRSAVSSSNRAFHFSTSFHELYPCQGSTQEEKDVPFTQR